MSILGNILIGFAAFAILGGFVALACAIRAGEADEQAEEALREAQRKAKQEGRI